MSKTEISAKILKSKKKVFIIGITPKIISTCAGWGLSFKPNIKQIHEAVQALESDIGFWLPSWILLKKAEKNYRANSLEPIYLLQIFRNNPSRGVWLYYQILIMAKMSKSEISSKILLLKKI